MIYTDKMLLSALEWAKTAHKGQFRKYSSEEYVQHPIRVAGRVNGIKLKIVALLHDVVEDGAVTPEMIDREFGKEITELVLAVSRMPEEKYTDFILRVKEYPEAVIVKIADINDNLQDLPAGDRLRDRYENALKVLR